MSEAGRRGAGRGAVRGFFALSGGEVASKLAGLLAFAYLARVLEPEGYGAVEVAVSLGLFFALVVDFGLAPIGAREVARAHARVPDLAAAIPTLRLGLALLAAPTMVGVAVAMGQPARTVGLVALFAVGLLAAPFNQRWLLQGLERMGWAAPGPAIRMGVFALGVVLLVRGPEDLLAVGVAEAGACAALALYYLAVQQRRVTPFRLRLPADGGALLRESATVGLGQIVWSLNQYLPMLLVATLVGGAEIGWFGAAHRIALSLATFSWIFHFNLFPAVSRSLGESRDAYLRLVRPSFRVASWAGIGVALGGSLLAEPICRLAFGEAFRAAAPVLAVLLWILPPMLLSGHARWALIAAGRQRHVLVAQSAGALATLLGGLVLIPAWGALGAAAAMVAAFVLVWLVAHAFVREVAPTPLWTVWRPLLAAGLAAAAGHGAGDSPWLVAAVAALVFAAAVPVLEPALLGDARRLFAGPAAVRRGMAS
jgi:O-antigen/teichoic acid export membrane protein